MKNGPRLDYVAPGNNIQLEYTTSMRQEHILHVVNLPFPRPKCYNQLLYFLKYTSLVKTKTSQVTFVLP
jgi:hypothetical protein